MLRTTTLTGVITLTSGLLAGSPLSVSAQTPNVVIQWNQIAQTLFTPVPGPSIRWLPILHIAMFDAINSIEEIYTPYRVHVKGSHGASAEAAAAQAARDVLTALLPGSTDHIRRGVGVPARFTACRPGQPGTGDRPTRC